MARCVGQLVHGLGRLDRHHHDVWEPLLSRPPDQWADILRRAGIIPSNDDDPVPRHLVEALGRINTEAMALGLNENWGQLAHEDLTVDGTPEAEPDAWWRRMTAGANGDEVVVRDRERMAFTFRASKAGPSLGEQLSDLCGAFRTGKRIKNLEGFGRNRP